jgi:hypothetical protein
MASQMIDCIELADVFRDLRDALNAANEIARSF